MVVVEAVEEGSEVDVGVDEEDMGKEEDEEDMEEAAVDMVVADKAMAEVDMEEVAEEDMEQAAAVAVDTEEEAVLATIERSYNASLIVCTRYCTLAL